MWRKKLLAVAMSGAVLLGLLGGTASAHILKQDNGVSAVLHIVPFDAPVSNEVTRIEVEFSNTDHTFAIQKYAVQLKLIDNGKTIATKPVEAAYLGTATTGVADITFPRANVYTIEVDGIPKSGQPAFHVDYTVRVTAGKGSTATPKSGLDTSAVLGIGLAAIIILVMFAAKQIISGERYKKTRKHKEN